MNKNLNITRQSIYDLVYRELGISKAYCSNFVDSLFDKIIYSLKSDKKVKLSLFGTFSKKKKILELEEILKQKKKKLYLLEM